MGEEGGLTPTNGEDGSRAVASQRENVQAGERMPNSLFYALARPPREGCGIDRSGGGGGGNPLSPPICKKGEVHPWGRIALWCHPRAPHPLVQPASPSVVSELGLFSRRRFINPAR